MIPSPGRCAVPGVVACIIFALVAAPGDASEGPRAALLPGAEDVQFVAEERCTPCHEAAARAWQRSDHALAMQVASDATVLGNFDDARFSAHGVTSRFFRRAGRFFVHTEGPDGAMADFEITHTFGVRPLQQYLVPFPGGRLQALSIAWDTERRAWFSLQPEERIAHDDALHWTGRYQSWNAMCAECHSTDLRKAYDPDADRYATTWAAINVGCQACHGPGARHVAWAEAGAKPEDDAKRGLLVDYAGATAHAEVETCARCHARRYRVAPEDRHARPFMDDFVARRLEQDLYHADGQILEEVYVYGSFVQSAMYRAGVRCTDCHAAHGPELHAEGNALCARCHQKTPDPVLHARFPSLPIGDYDAIEHHHHKPDSEASRCLACHMPATTYMVVDPRHDHSMRVPRPDLSAKLGVPNPCETCHADQSNRWSAAAIEGWYGPERRRGADFAVTLHDARAGAPGVGSDLARLAGDARAAPIVRATALELLARYGPPATPAIVAGLADPDPVLRLAAVTATGGLAPAEREPLLRPILADPIRAVRIEAARLLAALPREMLGEADRRRLEAGLAEYEAAQLAGADLAPAWLNLGVLRSETGRFDAAVAAYRRAIEQDRAFLPAWANLAQLHAARGRLDAAEAVLREAIGVDPEWGELHYSLGLLLAERGRLREARDALAEAARRMPSRPRVHYNLGLAEQHLGRAEQAAHALRRAQSLAPDDPAMSQALAILHFQRQDWDAALAYAEQWAALSPRDRNALGLVRRIEAERARRGRDATSGSEGIAR